MPGAYSHITIVNCLSTANHLETIPGLDTKIIQMILENPEFCELGSVAPDYPLLNMINPQSKRWSDRMHYENTDLPIKSGLKRIKESPISTWPKKVAWLMGYLSHYTADLVVHPVIESLVGPYEYAAKKHRQCECHQDAYIFQRLKIGEITDAEELHVGILRCSDRNDKSRIDGEIADLWTGILADSYPDAFIESKPDVHKWHSSYTRAIDRFAEEVNSIPPLARHIADYYGVVFPNRDRINRTFIDGLPTPEGSKSYDEIFDRALQKVSDNWAFLSEALISNEIPFAERIKNWNLGTGFVPKYIYWS